MTAWLPVTGRLVSLLPQLAFELLPESRRVQLYALAGIGAAHVRQRYFAASPFSASLAEPVEFTRSSLTVAVSYGGGVMVQISSRLAVGADVRSLHVFDEPAAADRFITPAGTLAPFESAHASAGDSDARVSSQPRPRECHRDRTRAAGPSHLARSSSPPLPSELTRTHDGARV